MKILLITYSINGGAGKACKRLYDALKASNNEVKILKLESGNNFDNDIVPMYLTNKDFFLKQISGKILKKIHTLKYRTFKTNYRLPFSVHKIEKHPLIKWADFINLHWVPDFIDYKFFFKSVRKPIIWTLHDMLPFSGGYHYTLDNLKKVKSIEESIVNLKYRYLKNSNIKIVSPSKWLTSVSSSSKVFRDFDHQHIFNPLPTNIFKIHDKFFSRRALNLPLKGKIVVFSADSITSNRKGMNTLIASLNLLNLNNLTLVSIGRNEIKIKSKIHHIHLGSLKDDYTISLLYSAADLSVVPSKEDNSPNTIIESFSCGCPVVAFNVGGIPELLFSEKMGIIVDKLDKNNLANAINNALKIKYSKELIRSFIESEFNYNLIANKYMSFFNSFKNDDKY
jgi:glycosyltransferase involved in cell wall biosynthesis